MYKLRATMRNTFLLQSSLLVLLHASLSSAQFCNTEVVKENGQMFRSFSSGRVRHCGSDFVYELDGRQGCGRCGILKLGYAMAEPCRADVEITFNNKRVADVHDATWIKSHGVTVSSGVEGSTDGFVGVFDGASAYIEIPLFEYSELGARVQITIRYREDQDLPQENTNMGLLSNSGDPNVLPTLAIVHSASADAVLAALNTTGGIFKQLNVPIPEDKRFQWKTITFDYNALLSDSRAQLILEDPRIVSTDSVIGNIRALRTAIVIGRGAFVDFFKGQIDFIRISRCAPVTNTMIP